MVVVAPGAMSKTGSPETVMALLIVVVPVTFRVAGTVGLPTRARRPEPRAALDGMASVAPLSTTTPPVNKLTPDRVVTPEPLMLTAPAPAIALAMVTLSERLKARVPLLVTAPAPREPDVPPLPICKVPALMVVAPA